MKEKFVAIIIILAFFLVALFSTSAQINDLDQNRVTYNSIITPDSRNTIEATSTGGSWLDTFNDNTYINSGSGLDNLNGDWILNQSFFIDDFDEHADNTDPDIWTEYNGNWKIENGEYSEDVTSPSFVNTYNPQIITDFILETDVKLLPGTNYEARITFRNDATGQYGYSFNIDGDDNILRLRSWLSSSSWSDIQTTGYTINTNTWYHIKIQNIGTNIQVFFNQNPTPTFNVNHATFQRGYVALGDILSHVHYDNFILVDPSPKFIQSTPVSIPSGQRWDTLLINKTELPNTYINITIEDPVSNNPIPGFNQIRTDGELDISTIDPIVYPSLRLKASFVGYRGNTPELHNWGLSWNTSSAWRDTFFNDLKVSTQTNLNPHDGYLNLSRNILFRESFEYGLSQWSMIGGSGTDPIPTTQRAHSGLASLKDWCNGRLATHAFPTPVSGDIEMWIYDTGHPDSNTFVISTPPNTIRAGINSGSTYWYRHNSNEYYSSIPRSDGWHKFSVSFSNSQCSIYIDDNFIASFPSPDDCSTLMLGEDWVTGQTHMNYDDILAWDGYKTNGYVVSTQISIPTKNHWDKVQIGKLTPSGTYLNITLLNATNDQPIAGFQQISESQIDISSIDPRAYPNLKLRGDYVSSGSLTPSLNNWSIGWVPNNIPEILDIQPSLPEVYRTDSISLSFNLSDNEEQEDALSPLIEYKPSFDMTWKTEFLGSPYFSGDHWRVVFTPLKEAHLYTYDFRVTATDTWGDSSSQIFTNIITVLNNLPSANIPVLNKDTVYRLNTATITVDATDIEDDLSLLHPNLDYRHVSGTWYSVTTYWDSGQWKATFTPSATKPVGYYDFRVRFQDDDEDWSPWAYANQSLLVLNNPPSTPSLKITPPEPYTTDDLLVEVYPVSDEENDPITLLYEWYCDDDLKDDLTGPIVASDETVKEQVWTCRVYANDTIDNSIPGEMSVTIKNSPPEAVSPPSSIDMQEDVPDTDSLNLYDIFRDADEDTLGFSRNGEEHIAIEIWQNNGTVIFRPEENWFGSEVITFTANDTQQSASFGVTVEVHEVNDIPVIEKVGDKSAMGVILSYSATEDIYFNTTVTAFDIDGDTLTYSCNLSDGGPDDIPTFYIDPQTGEISFLPRNSQVGTIFASLAVSDGRGGTDIQNISMDVANSNDPPQVTIDQPSTGINILESANSTFSCTVIDLDIFHGKESFSYEWSSNLSGILGNERTLVNISLDRGHHLITVKVTDSGGATSLDSVEITVLPDDDTDPFDEPEGDKGSRESNTWLYLLLIVIIIVILVVIFLLISRKKKDEEEEEIPQQVTPPSTGPIIQGTMVRPITPSVVSQAQRPSPLVPTPGPAQLGTKATLLLPLKTQDTIGDHPQTMEGPQKRAILMSQLERLAELKDSGILSEDEFAQKKEQLLKEF